MRQPGAAGPGYELATFPSKTTRNTRSSAQNGAKDCSTGKEPSAARRTPGMMSRAVLLLLPGLAVAQPGLDAGGVFPPPTSQRALGGQWSVDPTAFELVAVGEAGLMSARLQRALKRFHALTFDYGPAATPSAGTPTGAALQRLVVNVASGNDALTRFTDESYTLQIGSGNSPAPSPSPQPPGPPPPPAPPAHCSTEANTVFNTSHYADGSGPRTAANASECCDICGSVAGCVAFSFNVDAAVPGKECRWGTLTHCCALLADSGDKIANPSPTAPLVYQAKGVWTSGVIQKPGLADKSSPLLPTVATLNASTIYGALRGTKNDSHTYKHAIILSRQARDNHKLKKLKKEMRLLQGCRPSPSW